MNGYSVYCHTDPNGKKYFGISKNCLKRWNYGKGYIKNERFHEAITKYGWDGFTHEILKDGLTLDEANKMEKDLIDEHSTTDPLFGYNLRGGGSGHGFVTEETRRKQSEKRRGNTNCVGRVLSDETKNKISESLKEYYKTHQNAQLGKHLSTEHIAELKSRVFSDETRRKMSKNHHKVYGASNPCARGVRQLDLDGNKICDYEYASLAARTLGIDLSSLIKCCRGKNKTCGGYRWEYLTNLELQEVV